MTETGNLHNSEEAWDKKYQEWKKRDWMKWLCTNLAFPFTATMVEDHDRPLFSDIVEDEPSAWGIQ